MDKKDISYWLQTFGKPAGYKVLKEIMDYAGYEDKTEDIRVSHGRRQMMEFILSRLTAASDRKKEVYANIIYETLLL
ncbi:MAG TPA: hypothetical protein VI387_08585 [Candidatus Brocadiales bacterium]|nr:hypothetical protein [Candidatus Brocadiales bacterium]